MSDGDKDAAAMTEFCSAAWLAALGATSPWDLPLCFVPDDLITVKMVSPSRRAALRVLRMRETAYIDVVRQLFNMLGDVPLPPEHICIAIEVSKYRK
jgi:hypothetical protein